MNKQQTEIKDSIRYIIENCIMGAKQVNKVMELVDELVDDSSVPAVDLRKPDVEPAPMWLRTKEG